MSLHFLQLWTIGQKLSLIFLKDALLTELSQECPPVSHSGTFKIFWAIIRLIEHLQVQLCHQMSFIKSHCSFYIDLLCGALVPFLAGANVFCMDVDSAAIHKMKVILHSNLFIDLIIRVYKKRLY